MPYYDYCCSACPTRFEVRLPMGSRDLIRCPKCKGVSERVYAAPPNLAMYPVKSVRLNGEEIR